MMKFNKSDILLALETITIEGAILSLNNTLFLLPKN